MSLRKLIILACLLLFPALAVSAQENPRIYTIQKGDTLWGISQRFISDPLYWPNLWANNPFIHNPHLIYPGQKVAIYDGRIELLPEYQQNAAGEEQATQNAPTAQTDEIPVPQDEISFKAYGDLNSFISAEELDNAGKIVDTVDNRIMMTKDDKVFVQINDGAAQVGTVYDIFAVGKKIKHPHSGNKVGYQITWRGTLQITDTHTQVLSAVITHASGEIVRGNVLLPATTPDTSIVLKKARQAIDGYIIAANAEQLSLAQHDICYIDFGSINGLEVGNMLTIVRPRKATELALQDHNLKLPDTLLGRALVVKVNSASSAILILKSSQDIFCGDVVFTEVE